MQQEREVSKRSVPLFGARAVLSFRRVAKLARGLDSQLVRRLLLCNVDNGNEGGKERLRGPRQKLRNLFLGVL